MNAASYQRIKGANDRINIGFLGCGSRSREHQNMVKTSEKDKNLAVVAVCDIWKLNMYGIFGWSDIRQNPDTFQALATYEDTKLLYSYSSSYANKFGDYTCIRGKDATLFAHGGEGAARWFLIPENQRLP